MTERLYADPNIPTPWESEFHVPEFIGLSGYAQAGKDSVGQAFGKAFGHERMAFADVLREACYRLNTPVILVQGKDEIRVQEIVDALGWDDAKEQYDEIRRLLQVMGTDVGRWLDPNIWVNKIARQINETHQTKFVFTDCRFPNEAQWIKRKGGIIVRVQRPGVKAKNDHISEHALDDWPFDAYLANDGSLEDLPGKAVALIEELHG